MNQVDTINNGLGARLKSAREAMSLTIKEAAAHLHLSVNIIDNIEKEQFTDGPPLTFMRGYLRSYARFLNVPEHEIRKTLQELEITLPIKSAGLPILNTRPAQRTDRYLHWTTYLIVVTLVVLVALWWHSHQRYVIADVPTKSVAAQASSQGANTASTEMTSSATPAAENTTAANVSPSTNAGQTSYQPTLNNDARVETEAAAQSVTADAKASTVLAPTTQGNITPANSREKKSSASTAASGLPHGAPSQALSNSAYSGVPSPTSSSDPSSRSSSSDRLAHSTPDSASSEPGPSNVSPNSLSGASSTGASSNVPSTISSNAASQATPSNNTVASGEAPHPAATAANASSNTLVSPPVPPTANSTASTPTSVTAVAPPQVDVPPIISAASTAPPTELNPADASTAQPTVPPPAKHPRKHKSTGRHATLPGMPGINMALPEPG